MNYRYQSSPKPSSGMPPIVKTILLVVAGLFGAFIVVGTIVTIVIMVWVGRRADRIATVAANNSSSQATDTDSNNRVNGSGAGQTRTTIPTTPRLTVESITPPKTLDEAVEMLRREEWEYHTVAAKWLGGQQVNTDKTKEVAPILMSAYGRSSRAEDDLLTALEKWADRNIAADLAAKLSEHNRQNGRILAILARLNDPVAAAGIAPLLESRNDAAQARQIIISFGPQAAPFVAPFLLSENQAAKTHAEQILEEFGVDADEMLLEGLLTRLQESSDFELQETISMLSRMEPSEGTRERIGRELMNVARSRSGAFFAGRQLVPALEKWWIPEMIDVINEELEGSIDEDSKIYDLAAVHYNEETIEILCDKLKEDRFRRRPVTNCLIAIGQPALDAVNAIPPGGRFDEELDEEIERYMKTVDAGPMVPMSREIAAMEAADGTFELRDAFAAFRGKTPESLGLDAETHERVAQAMSAAVTRSSFGIDAAVKETYRAWVTPTSAGGLVKMLNEDFRPNADDVKRLAELQIPEIAGPVFEKLLSDRFKQNEVAATLRTVGPPVQSLCLHMLKTVSNTEIAVELVTNLSINGDETCIEPLMELAETAERRNVTPVARAAREAAREIRRRLGSQSSPTNNSDDDN